MGEATAEGPPVKKSCRYSIWCRKHSFPFRFQDWDIWIEKILYFKMTSHPKQSWSGSGFGSGHVPCNTITPQNQNSQVSWSWCILLGELSCHTQVSIAGFRKQNTIRVMIVLGMFRQSCWIKIIISRFQKLLKKMPFNNILPQVQSIKLMHFFPLHDFQNRTQSRSSLFLGFSS